MKRILVLLFLLTLWMCPAVFAADTGAQDAANHLYQFGLFNGTGTDANGAPIYDLDRAPTRHEAVTMLVRLLGKDEEAKAGNWQTPFTDVADWAKPYVGYAYTHKLTNGTGDTTFGGDAPVTATQYLTFVLRALGYSSTTDFRWDAAWELSDRLGITNGEYGSGNSAAFLRGDVVKISEQALSAAVPDAGITLLEKLQAEGAVAEKERPLFPQDLAPEGLIFTPVPEKHLEFWGGTTLKDFKLERLEYAACGEYVYFRLHYSGSALQKFFLLPWDQLTNEYGVMKRYAAPVAGNIFTCKVEKSTLMEYPVLAIAPSEDGQSGPDYMLYTGYLQVTADDRPVEFRPVEDVENDSYEVADFQFASLEYADVLGGTLYRLRFTNTAERTIQFWPIHHDGKFDTNINRIARTKAGDTEELFFVQEDALPELKEIYIRVRDAFKINPSGGNFQTHSGIYICY